MNPCTTVARQHGCICEEQADAPGYGTEISSRPLHGSPDSLESNPGFVFRKPPSRAPTLPGYALVSAAGFQLYADRPPIGESEAMREAVLKGGVRRASQISPIATVFPSEQIKRDTQPKIVGGSSTWRAENTAAYLRMPSEHLPACVLSLLRNVTVQNAAIYLDDSDACTAIYEMHRPNDYDTRVDENIHLRDRSRLSSENAYFFIASAGSHNWGHWLTDDLPRVAAAVFLREQLVDRKVTIVLLSFGQVIDRARKECVERHPNCQGVDVIFIERFIAYQFDELYYASPVTYHPSMKLRSAIDYVRRSFVAVNAKTVRKLFVTRPAQDSRSIVNLDEVEVYMRAIGFEVIECSQMTFEDQVRLFGEAAIVVGIMGAAMTNTIFSPAGIPVFYLACEGWLEPYYWDLADACDHRCSYIFGRSVEPHKVAHLSRFELTTALLDTALSQIID